MTSDQGPDQVRLRKVVQAACMSSLSEIFIDMNCLFHQIQLVVKTHLVTIDKWLDEYQALAGFTGYFATIAKVQHCRRDSAQDMFDAWVDKYAEASAVKHAKRLPPKCISGRWNSIEDCEVDLGTIGKDLLAPLLIGVLSQAALPGPEEEGAKVSACAIYDPRQDDQAHFRITR
eukprot:2524839-Pyramimonas_sp.AAC.1